MKSVGLALGVALASANEHEVPPDYTDMTYQKFLEEYPRDGEIIENFFRRADIFAKNLKIIVEHNVNYEDAKESWWMKATKFADWTPEEIASISGRKGFGMPGKKSSVALKKGANPDSVDWRNSNVMTPVKDQGQCGSCWAFASTETVESHYALASGNLVELAPQAFVSCMANPNSCGGQGGCEGAIAEIAFDYTADSGLPLASDYAYTASDSACQAYTPAVKVDGYVKLPANDADALETALATVGPVAVSVAAGQFYLYGGGIFTGCTGTTGTIVDHAVQAVGYSKNYWLIRNSWGPRWGEGGYIRLSRAEDNTIATDPEPADGFNCMPYPASIQVAGQCAVLSDSAYPTGARAASSQTVV